MERERESEREGRGQMNRMHVDPHAHVHPGSESSHVLIGQNAQVNTIRQSAVSQKKKGGHMPTALVVNLLKLENIAACGICCCPKCTKKHG
jgi:hypothetical protein